VWKGFPLTEVRKDKYCALRKSPRWIGLVGGLTTDYFLGVYSGKSSFHLSCCDC